MKRTVSIICLVSFFVGIVLAAVKMRSDPSNMITFGMKQCYEQEGMDRCYQKIAEVILQHATPSEILSVFSEHEQQPEIFSRCHEVTHYVGRDAYKKAQSIPSAFNSCTAVCHGGCYHGAVEGYMEEKRIGKSADDLFFTKEVPTLCGKEKDYPTPRLYGECLHGIGHALMFVTDGDLPRSLQLCDLLMEGMDFEACYGGVFMENSSSSTSADHPSRFVKADDPLYPCDALKDRYQTICYEYQSSYFFEMTGDWDKTIALCGRVPRVYQKGCFGILGSNQVGRTQDPQVMKSLCGRVADRANSQACSTGVVAGLAGRYVGNIEPMKEFCRGVTLADDREICYIALGAHLETWTRDTTQKERWCNLLEPPLARTSCINGRMKDL